MKQSYVYIVTNKNNTVLYIGITSDLINRIYEHREKFGDDKSFTKRYNLNKLIYYEVFGDIEIAIQREKHIKHWNREWKEELINIMNPDWNDLWDEITK